MKLQHQEVSDLEEAAQLYGNGKIGEIELNKVIGKIISNFKDYMEKRRLIIRSTDIMTFFAPIWKSSLENSASWIGGCRPSSFIRILYAQSGRDMESQIDKFLRGETERIPDFIGEFSKEQMTRIDELQRKIMREENVLSSKLANLQNDLLDLPLVARAQESGCGGIHGNHVVEEKGLKLLGTSLEEADNLRMKAVEEIVVNILKPSQAVDFLAAGKNIRICMREWGRQRDDHHRRSGSTSSATVAGQN